MFGIFDKKKDMQLVIDDKPEMVLQAKETILNGALRHNIPFPYSCKVGGCGSCKCILVEGKVKELTDKSYLLSKEEINNNYILGCQSIPKTRVVIKLPVLAFEQQIVKAVISEQKALTHDIFEVTLTLDKPMPFQAGQYVNVEVSDEEIPPRSYSFAHDFRDTSLSFFVRVIPNGKMSNWLTAPENINRNVVVNGPQGGFYYRESERDLLCIAGGSGLAPIISMLEAALASSNTMVERNLTLMMGARTQKDLYYGDEIKEIKKRWKGVFEFKAVLSEEPESSNWQGLRGFVTEHLDKTNCHNAQGYLCGPPPMIDAAISTMNSLGIDSDHIYFDKFLDQSQAS
jgi:NAD(P)H-flavin reductase/ferredoxin